MKFCCTFSNTGNFIFFAWSVSVVDLASDFYSFCIATESHAGAHMQYINVQQCSDIAVKKLQLLSCMYSIHHV